MPHISSTRVYYTFTFLHRFGLGATMTLYVPWLHAIGLSYAQISLINAIYWASVLFFELPTGMLADGRGRGWSVTVGSGIYALGGLAYAQATGFSSAVVAEIILSVGAAFMSGALSAWIADAKDRTEPLQKVYAHATFLTGVATVLANLLVVPLAQYFDAPVYWYALAAASGIASILAALQMRGREPEHPMREFEALHHAAAHLRRSSALRFAIVAQMAMGLFGAFNMYWALLILTRIDEMQMAILWTLMYVCLAAAGWFVRSRHGMGIHGASGMLLALTLGAAPMLFFGAWSAMGAWIVLLIIHELGRGMFAPYADAFVNEQIESGYRATYGSLQSLLGSIGMVLALLGCSLFMVLQGEGDPGPAAIIHLWQMAGGLAILIVIVLAIFHPKCRAT